MIKTQTKPKCLIGPEGKPRFGHFDAVPNQLGVDNFDYRNAMDKPAGALAKYFDFKQFQFVSLFTERYVVGIAIADIRYLASAFCYVYDREQDTIVEQTWLRPLGFDYKVSGSSFHGTCAIAGKLSFDIHQGQWHVHARSRHLECDLTLQPLTASLPLALCTPTGYSGWTYTQKHNGLRLDGKLEVNGHQVDLSQAFAGYDFSAGFMRRETSWRWASISGRNQGKIIGLNLAAGVNETGACENVLWVDGERHLLGPIQFEFNRDDLTQTWRISSANDAINLTFQPLNKRSEKLNVGFLKSNFRQFIGHFSGEISDNHGIKHQLHQIVGLTEDHYAKW